MNILFLFHVYECEECILTFAVEQALDDHSQICCPQCKVDDYVRDVCSGIMSMENKKTPAVTGVRC